MDSMEWFLGSVAVLTAAGGTGQADYRSDGVPDGTLDQRVRPV